MTSLTVIPRKFRAPVTRCALCSSRRDIVADGRDYRLPLSGEPVTKKLEQWWGARRPEEECPFEGLGIVAELPVCEPCLDLVLDVERVELVFRDFLDMLWNRLRASELLCGGGGGDGDVVVKKEDEGEKGPRELEFPPRLGSGLDLSALLEVKMAAEDDDDVSEAMEASPDPDLDFSHDEAVGSIVIRRRGERLPKPEPETEPDPEPESLLPLLPLSPPRTDGRPLRKAAVSARLAARAVAAAEEVHEKRPAKLSKIPKLKPSSANTTRAKKILRKIIHPKQVKALAATSAGHPASGAKKHTILTKRLPRKPNRKPRNRKVRKREEPSEPPSRICPICGVMLKGSDCILKKHISYVHHKEKVLQCQFCPERFEYHGKLYVHQAKVHQYRPERIVQQCEHCGKVVRAKWCMKEHLLTVHGIAPEREKVYQCERCPKRYLCLNKYKDHLNSHDGVRPYACPLCNIRMVRIDNLRQHAKRVHQKELRWRRGDDGVEVVEVAPSPVPPPS